MLRNQIKSLTKNIAAIQSINEDQKNRASISKLNGVVFKKIDQHWIDELKKSTSINGGAKLMTVPC